MMRIAIVIVLVTAASLVQAAGVYRWVDAGGNVHYSDQPVANAERVNAATLQSKTVQPAPEVQVSKRFRERVQRECATARERIAMYDRAGAVYGNTVTGVRYELDSVQRQRRIDELRAARAKYCAPHAAERLWQQASAKPDDETLPSDARRVDIQGNTISVSR